jgi:hypothetical protein
MKAIVIAFGAFTMLSGAALAADSDDTAPVEAPAIVDDATFDAQFQCPETITGADERIEEYARYVAWVRTAHPDWNFRKRLDVRYGLLKHHGCSATLVNIAMSGRPAFRP